MENSKYTYFWSIWFVFLAFAIVYSVQTKTMLDQRKQLKSSLTDLKKVLPQAQVLNKTMGDLSRELLSMAPNDPAARQIVADFKIKAMPSARKDERKNKE